MHVGILGGGVAGITLQRLLRHDSEILEREPVVGGLCRTFWKDGFGYDIGGHILFSKLQHVTDFVDETLGKNIRRCRRENKILYKGRYVKYPFENDLVALELEDRYECLIGYLKADYPVPSNLEEWSYATFGAGIAEKYLIPYNEKIWKRPARKMGLTWIGRIPRPPVEDVVKSALGISTEGYTHQLYFRYPEHGGAQALVDAIRRPDAPVRTGVAVERIRKNGRGWTVTGSDGEARRYDRIVVAFPVHEAVRCLQDVPANVMRAVAGLRYNAIRIALVAVNNESLMDKSAVYLPDPTVLPHRICYMGFFSPQLVRPGTSSLIAEVTTQSGDATDRMPVDLFLERVVTDLDRIGVISARDVITTDAIRVEYAYPVPDLAYAENVKVVREYFAAQGIPLLGRFAEFDYINSDEVIRRAMVLAESLNAAPC